MGMKVFASAMGAIAVTPSDSTSVTCKALYVGGAGDVAIAFGSADTAVTFSGVAAGTFLPIELKNGRVMSTNTTATLILALNW